MTTETLVDQPTTEPIVEPTLRAQCQRCEAGISFHHTANGGGIVVVNRFGMDVEASIGIGPNGFPECPNGHGEMEVASEAEQETDDDGPTQPSLPGIAPPFNYQGAYLELEAQAVECDRLKAEATSDAEAARASKKAWEKAAELYTALALRLRQTRREKVAKGEAITDVDTSRCAFEQHHPEQECPLCHPLPGEDVSVTYSDAPPDSVLHAERAATFLRDRLTSQIMGMLTDGAGMAVPAATISGWSEEDREAVRAWAEACCSNSGPLPERPKALGTMHVASAPIEGSPQVCTQCDAVLIAADPDATFYDAGWLVGTDCPGKPKEASHHYPKKTKGGKK